MQVSVHPRSTRLAFLACLIAYNPAVHANQPDPTAANLAGSALSEKMRAHNMVISASASSLQIKTKAGALGGFALDSLDSSASELAKKSVGQIATEGPAPDVANQLALALAAPDLKARLAQKNQAFQAEDLQLNIQQTKWKADFSKAANDFTLSHAVQVQLYQKSSRTVLFSGPCPDATKKISLQTTETDPSATIAKASQEIAKQCATHIMAKMQLKTIGK
jgi:hypothetical protein